MSSLSAAVQRYSGCGGCGGEDAVPAAELTPEGRKHFEQISPNRPQERELFEQLDAADLGDLDRGLRALMAVLSERLGPAPRRVNFAGSDRDSPRED